MEKIQNIHHLINIGEDKNNKEEFTKSIKYTIEGISDKVGYLINFVNESKYTKEDLEKIQILKLAETLQFFLSSNFLNPNFLGDLKGHPKEVIDFLYKILNGKWQILRRGFELEKKLLINRGCPKNPSKLLGFFLFNFFSKIKNDFR